MNLGPVELLVVLGILLILFGANRLPKLARSIGQSVKELRHANDEADVPGRQPGGGSRNGPPASEG